MADMNKIEYYVKQIDESLGNNTSIDGTLPRADLNKIQYYLEQIKNAMNVERSSFKIVDTLPNANISTSLIYLVLKSSDGEAGNIYNEYVNPTGNTTDWELIGDTKLDLSGYATKEELEEVVDMESRLVVNPSAAEIAAAPEGAMWLVTE